MIMIIIAIMPLRSMEWWETIEVVSGFKTETGMIQCAGAIDGCHIPVSPPALHHTDYYNRKGWYSVLVQGVVEPRPTLMNIFFVCFEGCPS